MARGARWEHCYVRLGCGCEHGISTAEYAAWVVDDAVECSKHGLASIVALSAIGTAS